MSKLQDLNYTDKFSLASPNGVFNLFGTGNDGILNLPDIYSTPPTPTAPNGGTASYAVDNNVTTTFTTNSLTAGLVALVLDYGSPVTLDTFIFNNISNTAGGQLNLQYSSDGTNYTTIASFTPSTTATPQLAVTFTATSARWWRITSVGASGVLTVTDVSGYQTYSIPSTLNGGLVVKQYSSVYIGIGNIVTVSNPCRGLSILSKSDITVNGLINMSKKGGFSDGYIYPLVTQFAQNNNKTNVLSKINTSKLWGGIGGNGGQAATFTSWTQLLSSRGGMGGQRLLCGGIGGGGAGGLEHTGGTSSKQGGDTTVELLSVGAGGSLRSITGSSTWTYNNGIAGVNGGGASGSSSSFYAGTAVSGAGGNCYGAGGGGGGGCSTTATSGTISATAGTDGEYSGGYLLLASSGSISIGAYATISANGGNGGSGGSGSYSGNGGGTGGGGAGGAGGGVIHIFYTSTYSNLGSIQVNGGLGGTYGAGGGAYNGSLVAGTNGTSGSIGTILIQQVPLQ